MIGLNVKSNVKQAIKGLDSIQKKQVPFATARALTWTAKDAQKAIQDAVPRTFNTSRVWYKQQQPTGIKIKPAKKLDLESVVFTSAYFAELQEDGGIKTPWKSKGLLVPTDLTPKYGRKAGGATRVLQGKKILRAGGRPTGNPLIMMQSGHRGIFRRKGKKRLPIEKLYSWTNKAKIKERFKFKSRAYHKALMTFNKNFAKSLSMALRTAR